MPEPIAYEPDTGVKSAIAVGVVAAQGLLLRTWEGDE